MDILKIRSIPKKPYPFKYEDLPHGVVFQVKGFPYLHLKLQIGFVDLDNSVFHATTEAKQEWEIRVFPATLTIEE